MHVSIWASSSDVTNSMINYVYPLITEPPKQSTSMDIVRDGCVEGENCLRNSSSCSHYYFINQKSLISLSL